MLDNDDPDAGGKSLPLRINVPDLAALPKIGMFPRTGLVKQYEYYIRKWVTSFCIQNPQVRRNEALAEAIKIAVDFEPKFKPELGNDFSTPLRRHLKGLYRILIVNPARAGFTKRDTETAQALGPDPEDLRQMLARPADRLRPLLGGNQHQLLVLDWMICPNGYTLTQIAAKAGISKGYASKIRRNLQRRMREEHSRTLIVRNK